MVHRKLGNREGGRAAGTCRKDESLPFIHLQGSSLSGVGQWGRPVHDPPHHTPGRGRGGREREREKGKGNRREEEIREGGAEPSY